MTINFAFLFKIFCVTPLSSILFQVNYSEFFLENAIINDQPSGLNATTILSFPQGEIEISPTLSATRKSGLPLVALVT